MKRGGVGQHRQNLTMARLKIAHEVFKPLHKAFTIGLNGFFQGIGIGGQIIGRREKIDDLAREELDLPFVARAEPLELRNSAAHRVGRDHILRLDRMEKRMRLPQRIGKALVLRLCLGGGQGEMTLRQFLLQLHVLRQGLRPIADLALHQLGGVCQRLLPDRHAGLEHQILPRPFKPRIAGLARTQCCDQAFGKRFHPRKVLVETFKALASIPLFGFVACHLDFAFLVVHLILAEPR